jgi:hypothetical protein
MPYIHFTLQSVRRVKKGLQKSINKRDQCKNKSNLLTEADSGAFLLLLLCQPTGALVFIEFLVLESSAVGKAF